MVYSLLARSYEEFISANPAFREQWLGDWTRYDEEVFSNPDTVGAAGFVTVVSGTPIGFGSYDPRQGPEWGIVGHNCILPEWRNKGYGRRQVGRILDIFRERGFKKAMVSTCDHPFFVPAQRMYLACGFVETGRRLNEQTPEHRIIEYEMKL